MSSHKQELMSKIRLRETSCGTPARPRAPPRPGGLREVQLHQLGPVRLLGEGAEPRHGGLVHRRIHQEGWTEAEQQSSHAHRDCKKKKQSAIFT